jgi:hypothetical protein
LCSWKHRKIIFFIKLKSIRRFSNIVVHTCWCICVFVLIGFDQRSKWIQVVLSKCVKVDFPSPIYIYYFYSIKFLVSHASINLYKLLKNFSGFLCSLFLLIYEHNLIFRCSKISFHVFQILYLGSSCSIMSLRIFPEFSELSKYFPRLK